MFLEERTLGAKAPSGKKLGRLGKEGEDPNVSSGRRGRNRNLQGLAGHVKVSGFYC